MTSDPRTQVPVSSSTHASILSDAGTHVEALADRMGHRDSRTTLTYYRHQITPVIEVGGDVDFGTG
jgi:hypothetical protein